MYFPPLAWLLVETGYASSNFDASSITLSGIIHNMVPVTLGNVVGGAGFVGLFIGRFIARRLPHHIRATGK